MTRSTNSCLAFLHTSSVHVATFDRLMDDLGLGVLVRRPCLAPLPRELPSFFPRVFRTALFGADALFESRKSHRIE